MEVMNYGFLSKIHSVLYLFVHIAMESCHQLPRSRVAELRWEAATAVSDRGRNCMYSTRSLLQCHILSVEPDGWP